MKPRITSSASDEILRAAGLKGPIAAWVARSTALELAAALSRYVAHGTALEGALVLSDKLASSKGYERAAELILRASPTPLDQPPFASWGDLIEAVDAVDAWLRTGELPADPAALLRAFPSVAAYQ
jgi:hypothetical protein